MEPTGWLGQLPAAFFLLIGFIVLDLLTVPAFAARSEFASRIMGTLCGPKVTFLPMGKGALIVWGGWDGHEPEKVARFFEELLKAEGFEVEVANTLDAFADAEKLAGLSLIVPIYTMGEIKPAQRDPVIKAVSEHGVGIAGCHGGMCDSFRADTEWQFMTGGQWVAHPGNDGVKYTINIDRSKAHPITDGIDDFEVASEQYYLHTDPGNNVLATTDFPTPGADGPHVANVCKMPQIWTKRYGAGRVYYNALGHHCDILEAEPVRELMRRGFLWAAK